MSLEGGLDQWFIETLLDLQASGWRCVPIRGRQTLPYGDGQTYYCPTEYLGKAVAVGVVLDSAVLLDWDGNKPEAVGKIISLEALGHELGADLGQPVQANKAGNSFTICGAGVRALSRRGPHVTVGSRLSISRPAISSCTSNPAKF